MSDHQPLKRRKLSENVIKKSSSLFEPLDQEINGDDEAARVEISTLKAIKEDQNEDAAEIPTLVVELFLHWTQDVNLLKTCRLVNKYWNSLACSSLQIHSVVKFGTYRGLQLQEFIIFQELKSGGDLPLNPSPFKNVHIDADVFNDENYFKLTKIPNITITSLTTCTRYINNLKGTLEYLNQLLKVTMKNLRNLTIKVLHCGTTPRIFHEVKFSALKSLCIVTIENCGGSATCDWRKHLNMALENSKLQQLTVGSKNYPYNVLETALCSPSSLLTILNLSSIVEFHLWDKMEEHVWNGLQRLQLPSLKAFSIEQKSELSNETKQIQLSGFLKNVASTLINLFIKCGAELDVSLIFGETVFPQLKFLRVPSPRNISLFVTRGRFPSLQCLYIGINQVHQLSFVSDGSDSLSTVWKVVFTLNVQNDAHSHRVSKLFPHFIVNTAKQFPYVKSLKVWSAVFSNSFSLLDISRAYPNLEILRIKPFAHLYLSGTDKVGHRPDLDLGLYKETLNQDIPLEATLLDFKKLRCLDLSGSKIATEIFQHSLPRMTALKDLRFTYYGSEPSVEILAEGLKHVKHLTIYSRTLEPQLTLLALVEALPFSEITLN